MKYILLVYGEEQAWTEQERSECMNESTQLCHDLHRAGRYLGASPLQPVAAATSVKVRMGKRLITGGPFAETHEQLGGYFWSRSIISMKPLPLQAGYPPRQKAPSKSVRWQNWKAFRKFSDFGDRFVEKFYPCSTNDEKHIYLL